MNKITLFFISIILPCTLLAQAKVSHQAFDQLLQKYVNEEGLVDYVNLKKNTKKLEAYLRHLEGNPVEESWTSNEQLAYWINAYNAYTLKLIIDNYPVESIKDVGATIQIPFVNSPWDIKFIKIDGEEYDLNNIEHGIIRKEFDEPRIHFALVCAAISCPKLQNQAYLPEKLDNQLDAAAKTFLRDKTKNKFTDSRNASLSKLFSWYGGDFKKEGSLIEYINRYAPVKLDDQARIDWMDYNWWLNEQKK